MGTMRTMLRSCVAERIRIRVDLDSGHHLEVRVTGTGDDWFAGERCGAIDEDSAVIVLFRSIRSMQSDDGGGLSGDNPASLAPVPAKPLGAMVANVASLRKRVSVYGPQNRWQGTVIAGFEDYAVLRTLGSKDLVVPYSALSWIAVY
jgi:hypothetical protein